MATRWIVAEAMRATIKHKKTSVRPAFTCSPIEDIWKFDRAVSKKTKTKEPKAPAINVPNLEAAKSSWKEKKGYWIDDIKWIKIPIVPQESLKKRISP